MHNTRKIIVSVIPFCENQMGGFGVGVEHRR